MGSRVKGFLHGSVNSDVVEALGNIGHMLVDQLVQGRREGRAVLQYGMNFRCSANLSYSESPGVTAEEKSCRMVRVDSDAIYPLHRDHRMEEGA